MNERKKEAKEAAKGKAMKVNYESEIRLKIINLFRSKLSSEEASVISHLSALLFFGFT